MTAVLEQAPPAPDAEVVNLPPIPTNMSGYDGPTTTADRILEAKLVAEDPLNTAVHPMYRRSPGAVYALLYRAQALNVPVGIAMDHIYVNTSVGKSGLSAQLMAYLLLRSGVTWTTPKLDDKVAEFKFYRTRTVPGRTGRAATKRYIGTVRWHITEAVKLGLVSRLHWQAVPQDCLWARALARGCRRFFSDIVMGMGYTPEEIADMAAGPEVLPDDAADTVAPEVQEYLDQAVTDGTTADQIRNEIMAHARKKKLLKTELPDGRTLEQALTELWTMAKARESAAAADTALADVIAGIEHAEPAPPAVLDKTAGDGDLPCGCPAHIIISGAPHAEGVCHDPDAASPTPSHA